MIMITDDLQVPAEPLASSLLSLSDDTILLLLLVYSQRIQHVLSLIKTLTFSIDMSK